MAVKRATKKEDLEVNVTVDEVETKPDTTPTPDEVTTTDEVDETTTPDVSPDEGDETEDLSVDETTTNDEEPLIEVDTDIADVSNAPKEKNVRVKIKKDIKFDFGKEHYELLAGHCYNVPVAVKLHLNKFDALSPL